MNDLQYTQSLGIYSLPSYLLQYGDRTMLIKSFKCFTLTYNIRDYNFTVSSALLSNGRAEREILQVQDRNDRKDYLYSYIQYRFFNKKPNCLYITHKPILLSA